MGIFEKNISLKVNISDISECHRPKPCLFGHTMYSVIGHIEVFLFFFQMEGVSWCNEQTLSVSEALLSFLSLHSVLDKKSTTTQNNQLLCGNVLTMELLLHSTVLWRLEALFETRLWCVFLLVVVPIFRAVQFHFIILSF